MITTRFNPSATGALHLGHVYTMLVNEQFAHNADGKFYIRFDDTDGAITIEMEHPERVSAIIEEQIDIIKWLEVSVDGWSFQSDIIDEVRTEVKKHGQFRYPYPHELPVFVRMIGTGWIPFPYTSKETAERVVMDHMLGITHIIRGEEFSTEFSLYRYFCDLFELPHPHFIFLPRLMARGGDISKTNGGYTIAELKSQGYHPEDINSLLRNACLRYFGSDWSIYNLRSNPKLDI